MVYQGKIIISGVAYGQAVVLVQPKRGCAGARCDGQVCKILHDPRDRAPASVPGHLPLDRNRPSGPMSWSTWAPTGNLEFLPGKNLGLSPDCLPDVALHEIPHLYIYNCDNPPEGTVAKRRSLAVLVDHMQTAMDPRRAVPGPGGARPAPGAVRAGQEVADKTRAHALEHLICAAIRRANLDKELRLDPTAGEHDQDFPAIVREAHEALSRASATR